MTFSTAPSARSSAMPSAARLEAQDPEVFQAMQGELGRQREQIELIASENIVSAAVLAAQGSVLTNKYAEGYPGRRYYGGCEFVDVAEELARERAKQLFDCDYANVQPHSGSQANAAVYLALLEPGDAILGMSLAHGGHLTHGAKVNFSGRLFRAEQYGLDAATGEVDYEEVARLARAHRPKLIMTGFSAYSRVLDWARFRAIADEVGAYLVADIAHVAGLVAAGLYPSPIPHADVVTSTTHKTLRGPRAGLILCTQELAQAVDKTVFPGQQGGPLVHIVAAKAVAFAEALRPEFRSYAAQIIANAKALAEALQAAGFRLVSGGTDNHLMLVDVFQKGIMGNEAELALGKAGITVNKNSIPWDTNPPLKPSGIRVGTPALTTRGMKEAEMRQIGVWIAKALESRNDDAALDRIRGEVSEMANQFPLYAWRRAPAAVSA